MKYIFFAVLLISIVSCKKTEHQPPFVNTGNPNNKMEVDIALANSSYHISAWGDYTLFGKLGYSNGDTTITILGSNDTSQIDIRLFNINSPGAYKFGNQPVPGQSLSISYEHGHTLGLGGPYFSNTSALLTGEIIIESITNAGIKGSFRDTCWNGTNRCIINNGTFNGEF